MSRALWRLFWWLVFLAGCGGSRFVEGAAAGDVDAGDALAAAAAGDAGAELELEAAAPRLEAAADVGAELEAARPVDARADVLTYLDAGADVAQEHDGAREASSCSAPTLMCFPSCPAPFVGCAQPWPLNCVNTVCCQACP